MEWYSEVVGMPVINIEDGRKLGNIKDIAFNLQSGEIIGFVLENNGIFGNSCLLPLSDVVNVLKGSIVVKGALAKRGILRTIGADIGKNPETGQDKENCADLSAIKMKDIAKARVAEKKVCSGNGQEIGVVKDFLFDMETGVIEGFELSDGLVEDLMRGRRLLPLLGKVTYGRDRIIVGDEAINEIVDTGGGLIKKRDEGKE